ncbi:MAG: hypothetical protein COA99_15160 [Moraxellaceae bacterium]|nr:MAG: hypothetical protein COA99_15160 [Moraxellaceae bacterium]
MIGVIQGSQILKTAELKKFRYTFILCSTFALSGCPMEHYQSLYGAVCWSNTGNQVGQFFSTSPFATGK